MRHSLNTGELNKKPNPKVTCVPKFARQKSNPELKAKQQELNFCTQDLEQTKSDYELWKKEFSKKIDSLNEKKMKFQEQKQNLENFLKVYTNEIEKAENHKVEEEMKYKNIYLQYQEMQNEIQMQQEESKELKDVLDKLQPYTDFMQEAVVISRHFNTIDELINQFDRIIETKQDRLKLFSQLIDDIDKQRREQEQLQKLEDTYVVDAENRYHRALVRLNKAIKTRRQRKAFLFRDQTKNFDTATEISNLKTSIQTIYNMVMRDLGFNPADHSVSTEQMVKTIKTQILDLNEIIKTCKFEI